MDLDAMDFMTSRAVQRVIAELRCGAPVLLQGARNWGVLPVETADETGLAVWRSVCTPPFLLGLGAGRAARLLGTEMTGPAAFLLQDDRLSPTALAGWADPLHSSTKPLPTRAETPADLGNAVRLAKLAQLLPAVLMAPAQHDAASAGLLAVTQAQIETYPADVAADLQPVSEAPVALHGFGDTQIIVFRPRDGGLEHLAIVIGQPDRQSAPLVRLHSACLTGDVLGSLRCDCGPQLHAALRQIAAEKHGVVLYLAQEGRGIGLANKLRAYLLQDGAQDRTALDTLDANHALGWDADERDFTAAAAMLRALNITRLRLITNNPAKIVALQALGIAVTGQQPNRIAANGVNDAYLQTKRDRFGHLL